MITIKDTIIWKALRYIKYELFNIQFKKIYILDLAAADHHTKNEYNTIRFKFSSFEDIEKLSGSEYDYEKDDLEFSRQRLKEGDSIVIGYINQYPVFYGWQMFGQFELSYMKYHQLSPEIIYSYKVYVISEQRNKSILRKYYQFISSYYSARGIKSIIVVIDDKNIPSIIAHQKCGFIQAGKIISIKFASITFNIHNINI